MLESADYPKSIDGHEVLDFLGQGGFGWVFRVRTHDGQEHALKLLRNVAGLTRLDVLRFKREFQVASGLSHPGLVRVHGSGVSQGQPYYTMDFVPGQNICQFVNGDRERLEKVMTRLLETLAYLHSRRIVHRDLKPENILVDPEDGTPRLLDFGLARGLQGSHQLTETGTVMGTTYYMAPELLSTGKVDPRGDLYSLGVILYEALTGKLPFTASNPVTAIHHILMEDPAPPSTHLPGLPPELDQLIMKLLSKDPADRYHSAQETLHAWRRVFEGELPEDFMRPEAPELQTSEFVGRKVELDCLLNLMEPSEKRPLLALVAGESGVGKTRLLQELADYASDQIVTWGYGYEFEALPYQHWIPVLRQATRAELPPELAPFRRALSVLLPDLAQANEPPPSSEDPMQKFHLFEGMARLLATGGRRLLLMDDLQWADPASLEFLLYLVRRHELPNCLLVASYRVEAVDQSPGLAKLVQWGRGSTVTLEPFDLEETEAMVRSMLGATGQDPETTRQLHEETSGNPLFVAEVLKALASEGRLKLQRGLWHLDTETLPRTTTGGTRIPMTVREAVKRRLSGLEPETLEVAEAAAVLGRSFDAGLLARVVGRNVNAQVDLLLARRIFAQREPGLMGFYNQPLVEVVQESLAGERQQTLHLAAARALEGRFATREITLELARHYLRAGKSAEAAVHLTRGAEIALSSFAYEEAAQLLEAALAVEHKPELEERLADARFGSGQTAEAQQSYERLGLHESDRLRQARLLRKQGTCHLARGDVAAAYDALLEARQKLGVGTVSTSLGRKLTLPLRLLGSLLPTSRRQADQETAELHAIQERLGQALFFLNPPGWKLDMLDITLREQQVARAAGGGEARVTSRLSLAYALLGGPAGSARMAPGLLRTALTELEHHEDGLFKATQLRNIGFFLHLSGLRQEALRTEQAALDIFARSGDLYGLSLAHSIMEQIHREGGWLEPAEEHARRSLECSEAVSNPMELALAYLKMVFVLTARGRLTEAQEYLEKAEEMRGKHRAPYVEMRHWAASGWLALARGDYARAGSDARQARQMVKTNKSLPFFKGEAVSLEGLALSHRPEPGSLRLVTGWRRKMRGFPLYEAMLGRAQARLLMGEGKSELALQIARQVLESFQRLDNPTQSGRTSVLLEQIEPGKGHKDRSEEFFRQAGTLDLLRNYEQM